MQTTMMMAMGRDIFFIKFVAYKCSCGFSNPPFGVRGCNNEPLCILRISILERSYRILQEHNVDPLSSILKYNYLLTPRSIRDLAIQNAAIDIKVPGVVIPSVSHSIKIFLKRIS